jgi:hypothetical protein
MKKFLRTVEDVEQLATSWGMSVQLEPYEVEGVQLALTGIYTAAYRWSLPV